MEVGYGMLRTVTMVIIRTNDSPFLPLERLLLMHTGG
jgi:hypothetical protein